MNGYIGITDSDWFHYLASLDAVEPLVEVNFWRPSGRDSFRALEENELFLFKLHAPDHFIAGGGFFAQFVQLPYRTAWNFFAETNGAATLPEMRERIERYRRVRTDPHEDYMIGCILLAAPFFLDRSEWIPVPRDWSPHIQRGKTYDLSVGLGAELWREVQIRAQAKELARSEQSPVVKSPGGRTRPTQPSLPTLRREHVGPMWSEPIPVRRRLGQGLFRAMVSDTYQWRCAVTQEKAWPVLEAAHIRPVSEGGRHLIENGLLLRSDLHRLYDSGYLTVTPEHRVRVSARLKTDFENGEPYYPLEGHEIWLPGDPESRPSSEFLQWHEATVFRK